MKEEEWMRRAVELARRGTGHTSPNPLVGAVLVKEGRVIGEGWHAMIGGLHAERNALKDCRARGENPAGAALYVTLEPCCHYGKQPPCTDAILEAGISRVVVGSRDPNPKVAGKGVRILREAGVEVATDFLRDECDALNPVFFHYIQTREPYVALKYAMTADGKTAANSGDSWWITGEGARAHVHELRNAYTGILAGVGTVLADDPLLTCRMPGGRNPVRIILDSSLKLPLSSKLVQTAAESPVFAACVKNRASDDKKQALEARGVRILELPADAAGGVSVPELLKELGRLEIDGILVEGGGTVNASFLRCGKVNRVYAYVGAQIFGGRGNRFTPVGGAGIEQVKDSLKLEKPQVQIFGDDVLLTYDCGTKNGGREEAKSGCLPES